jgi:hypothetical protein
MRFRLLALALASCRKEAASETASRTSPITVNVSSVSIMPSPSVGGGQ